MTGCRDLTMFSDGRTIPKDALESFIFWLNFIYRDLLVIEHLDAGQHQGIEIVRQSQSTLRNIFEFPTYV